MEFILTVSRNSDLNLKVSYEDNFYVL